MVSRVVLAVWAAVAAAVPCSADSKFSTAKAVDVTGHFKSPSFYCVNNCLCDNVYVTQQQDNASMAVMRPSRYSSPGCGCNGNPLYIAVPDVVPTSTVNVSCWFQSQFIGSTCSCYALPDSNWPYMTFRATCGTPSGANRCSAWYRRVYGTNTYDDDDDNDNDNNNDNGNAPTVQTKPASQDSTAPPYVVWGPASQNLREEPFIQGRAAVHGSPVQALANRTLVDAPVAVAVPDAAGDAVLYTDKGGRLIQLSPSAMDAAVVLDMKQPDNVIIDSLALQPGSPTVAWFTMTNTLYKFPLSGDATPVAMYHCTTNCSNVRYNGGALYFAMVDAKPASTAAVYTVAVPSTPLPPGMSSLKVLVKAVRRAVTTIVPLAVDAANDRLFFGDYVFGVRAVSLDGSGADLLTIVEPDGYAVDVLLQGSTLYYLTLLGDVSSVDVSPSGLDARRAAALSGGRRTSGARELGNSKPPAVTRHGLAFWHDDVVVTVSASANGPLLFHGADPSNRTVLYAQWYRQFGTFGVQAESEACRLSQLGYSGNPTRTSLVVQSIPEHGPPRTAWTEAPVYTNTYATAFVVADTAGSVYRSQSLATNENGVVHVDSTGRELQTLCSDAGRGVVGDLYAVDGATGDMYYVGHGSYSGHSTVFRWHPAKRDVYTFLAGVPFGASGITFHAESNTVFVVGMDGNTAKIVRFSATDGSSYTVVYSAASKINTVGKISSVQAVGKELFWVESLTGSYTLRSSGLDGSAPSVLLTSGASSSNAAGVPQLSVHPDGSSYMFVDSAYGITHRYMLTANRTGDGSWNPPTPKPFVPFQDVGQMFPDPTSDKVRYVDGLWVPGWRLASFDVGSALKHDGDGILTEFDIEFAKLNTSVGYVFMDQDSDLIVYESGNSLWSCALNGTNTKLLQATMPDNFVNCAVDFKASPLMMYCSTQVNPYSRGTSSFVVYEPVSNITNAIMDSVPLSSSQFGPVAVTNDGSKVLFTQSHLVRSPTSSNPVFQTTVWSCNAGSLATCISSVMVAINVTETTAYAPQTLELTPNDTTLFLTATSSPQVVLCDLSVGGYRFFDVTAPHNMRWNVFALKYSPHHDQLLVSFTASTGASIYSVCMVPAPAEFANVTAVPVELVSAFRPVAVTMDWSTGDAYVQLNGLSMPWVLGKVLVFNIHTGARRWVPLTTPPNLGEVGNLNLPAVKVVTSASGPASHLLYNARWTHGVNTFALVQYSPSGTSPTVLLEEVTARPYALMLDAADNVVAWLDTNLEGATVVRRCAVNVSGNGTGVDLLTSTNTFPMVPRPTTFRAAAVFQSALITAHANGTVLTAPLDAAPGTASVLAQSAQLINATSLVVEPTSAVAFVGVTSGHIWQLDLTAPPPVAPTLFHTAPPGGTSLLLATPSIAHCF